MNEAITIVYYIINKLFDLIFNKLQVVPGVSIGWIIVTIFVFSILINAILNIPNTSSDKGDDDNG